MGSKKKNLQNKNGIISYWKQHLKLNKSFFFFFFMILFVKKIIYLIINNYLFNFIFLKNLNFYETKANKTVCSYFDLQKKNKKNSKNFIIKNLNFLTKFTDQFKDVFLIDKNSKELKNDWPQNNCFTILNIKTEENLQFSAYFNTYIDNNNYNNNIIIKKKINFLSLQNCFKNLNFLGFFFLLTYNYWTILKLNSFFIKKKFKYLKTKKYKNIKSRQLISKIKTIFLKM